MFISKRRQRLKKIRDRASSSLIPTWDENLADLKAFGEEMLKKISKPKATPPSSKK
jgi:hypothetical protein